MKPENNFWSLAGVSNGIEELRESTPVQCPVLVFSCVSFLNHSKMHRIWDFDAKRQLSGKGMLKYLNCCPYWKVRCNSLIDHNREVF